MLLKKKNDRVFHSLKPTSITEDEVIYFCVAVPKLDHVESN